MESKMFGGCNAPDQSVPPGPESGQRPSQLFTLRLWPEELGNGAVEWRGSVQHVSSGQRRAFREWPALVAALQEMLAAREEESESIGQSIGQEATHGQGESP